MIRLVTQIHVDDLKGKEITDFFASCNEEAYQQWWPGTHIQMHPVKGRGLSATLVMVCSPAKGCVIFDHHRHTMAASHDFAELSTHYRIGRLVGAVG